MATKIKKTFWDSFEGLYQMGWSKHRGYLLDWMKSNNVSSFLDVGCGTGPLYELNRDEKYQLRYKGTDYSWAMIDVANEHFPEADPKFEVQDARKLTEPDNSWDCVVLMHCLDHLDDYKAAISEATRVSSKYVIIVLWRPFVADGERLNDRNMMNKEPNEKPWEDTYLHEYSRDLLETEFKKNNLKIIELVTGPEINDGNQCNIMYILKNEKD